MAIRERSNIRPVVHSAKQEEVEHTLCCSLRFLSRRSYLAIRERSKARCVVHSAKQEEL